MGFAALNPSYGALLNTSRSLWIVARLRGNLRPDVRPPISLSAARRMINSKSVTREEPHE
jgi:hypothetical protein